ncbi:MAG: hypothetical protein FIA91_02265 [Geobacter sp.]|nr:hypothetical protein [Geobacter sp.]
MASTKYLNEVLPYKLNAVHQLELALHRHIKWVEDGVRPNIEIKFDSKTSTVGNSNAYINPVLESGIVHIRSILEFLGLRYDKHSKKLVPVQNRQPDDAGVEKLEIKGTNLKMIDLQTLTAEMGNKGELILESLAFVAWLANKFVAHFTVLVNDDKNTLYKILVAAQATPVITINHVYLPHGLPSPGYKNDFMP